MRNNFLNVFESLTEAFKELSRSLSYAWGRSDSYGENVSRILKVIKSNKSLNKLRYKPVVKIAPNKEILLNRKLKFHNCRNNC